MSILITCPIDTRGAAVKRQPLPSLIFKLKTQKIKFKMITTFIISMESMLIVALAILAYVLNKKLHKARKNLFFKKLAIFDVLLGIQNGIDKFNEKYDVQLKLGFTEDENGKEKPTLIFTDPKDDIESSPVEEEQHSSN